MFCLFLFTEWLKKWRRQTGFNAWKRNSTKIRTLKLLYCANVNGGCQQFVVLSKGYCEKQIGVESRNFALKIYLKRWQPPMWVEFFSVALQRNDISKTKIDLNTSSDYPIMVEEQKIIKTLWENFHHIWLWTHILLIWFSTIVYFENMLDFLTGELARIF